MAQQLMGVFSLVPLLVLFADIAHFRLLVFYNYSSNYARKFYREPTGSKHKSTVFPLPLPKGNCRFP